MKKLLSLCMCLVFIVTLLPIVPTTARAASGVAWNYTGGTLTISGSGSINYTTIPWNEHKSEIRSVVIGGGITYIQADAFSDCTALEEVTISVDTGSNGSVKGVKTIGKNAFSGCTELKSITLPCTVETLGAGAFSDCTALSEIKLAENAEDFPKYLRDIGKTVFENTAFYNDESNWSDGFLYLGDYLIKAKDTVVTANIKDGTKVIAGGAFLNNKALKSVTFPVGIDYIGHSAFYGCDGLTEIELPNGCTIYSGSFAYCRSLKKAVVPADVVIDGAAFLSSYGVVLFCDENSSAHKYALEDIVLYKLNNDLTPELPAGGMCGENLYWRLEMDGTFYINGSGEMSFDEVPWEAEKHRIKSADIFKGNIPDGAFKNCTALETVYIYANTQTIGDDAFSGCSALKHVVIKKGIKEIGERAFSGCTSLETIALPTTVENIGKGAFKDCTALENVIFQSDATIDENTFSGCDNVTLICSGTGEVATYAIENEIDYIKIVNQDFSGSTQWIIDEEGTFWYMGTGGAHTYLNSVDNTDWIARKKYIKNAVILYGITDIRDCCFYNCANLETVKIPASVKTSAIHAFGGTTKVKEVHIEDVAAWCGIYFESSDSNPLSTGAKLYVNGDFAEELVIPEGVKTIKPYAFYGCDHIESLVLPEGLESVLNFAFCKANFKKIKIPASLQCDAVRMRDAFYSANERDVYVDDINVWSSGIAEHFTGAGYNLYVNNELVTHLVIPDGTTKIERGAFYNCKSLEKVTIPKSLKSVGFLAFGECTEIKEVYIEDMDAWGNISYANHPSDSSYGENNPLQYGADLYLNGELVTEITELKKASSYMFYGCKSLKRVNIAEGVTGISQYAFYKCLNLEEVIMPDTVVSIGIDAFEGTPYRSNSKSYGDDGVLYGGKCVVAAKPNITKADIKEGTVSIAPHAFKDCTNLKTITFPESLQIIGKEAFMFCESLDNVEVPEGVTTLQDGAFWCCKSLKNMAIYGKDTKIVGFWYLVPAILIITGQMDSPAQDFAVKQGYRYRYVGTETIIGGSLPGTENSGTPGAITGGGNSGGSTVVKPKQVVGLSNFKPANTYDNTFKDVANDAWYQDSVKTAFELGLVKGVSDDKFNPDGNMTIAEAITLAARLHSIYNTGKAEFIQGDIWYQVYVDYAIEKGIITKDQFTDYNAPAKRSDFAKIFAKAISESDYNAINNIKAGDIPDVSDDANVYLLYNAGILQGSDSAHSFLPDSNIKRSEVATIITRIANKEKRVTFEIK